MTVEKLKSLTDRAAVVLAVLASAPGPVGGPTIVERYQEIYDGDTPETYVSGYLRRLCQVGYAEKVGRLKTTHAYQITEEGRNALTDLKTALNAKVKILKRDCIPPSDLAVIKKRTNAA